MEAEFRECLLPLQGQLLFPVVDLIAFFKEVGFVLICQLVCSFRFQVSSSSASFLFTTFRFFTQQSMLLLLCRFANLTEQKKQAPPTSVFGFLPSPVFNFCCDV